MTYHAKQQYVHIPAEDAEEVNKMYTKEILSYKIIKLSGVCILYKSWQ